MLLKKARSRTAFTEAIVQFGVELKGGKLLGSGG
jgi:hypothetical protein